MLFYPWYPALMLAVESNNVVDIRLRKIARGGVNAADESLLMLNEKIDAPCEAGRMLISRKPAEVIDFYRMPVSANAARLS